MSTHSQSNNSLLSTLFRRDPDADYLEGAPPWRVGLSMAATWSWGAAVAVAIAVLHTLGLYPFIVWTFFNCLSIGLFGVYYRFIPNVPKWKYLLPMVLMWGFIGFFAVVMNMNTILAVLGGNMDIPAVGFLAPNVALWTTIGIGLLIAWFIGVYGLRGSVFTDVGQFALQFVGAIGILLVGLMNGYSAEFALGADQTSFMITGTMGFVFGATASGMQWQRIETLPTQSQKFRAALWGSAMFTVFLAGVVTPAAFVYQGGVLQSIFLVIAALAVATSTADSGSALLQYVSQRVSLPASGGTIVTLAAVLSFSFFAEMGLTGIWAFYAGIRWQVILAVLIGTVIYNVAGPFDELEALAKKVYLVIPDRIFSDEELAKRYDVDIDEAPKPADD